MSFRRGDLVSRDDGYHGIVTGSLSRSDERFVLVFLGNGLSVERTPEALTPVPLPGSTAVSNFAEIMAEARQ